MCASGMNPYQETHKEMEESVLCTAYECCCSVHSVSPHALGVRRQSVVTRKLQVHIQTMTFFENCFLLFFFVLFSLSIYYYFSMHSRVYRYSGRYEWIKLKKSFQQTLSSGSSKFVYSLNDKTCLKNLEYYLNFRFLQK